MAVLTAPENNGDSGIYSHLTRNLQNFEKLEPVPCMDAYETNFITDHGDLIIILDAAINTTFHRLESSNPISPIDLESPYLWMCNRLSNAYCDLAAVRENATRGEWTVKVAEVTGEPYDIWSIAKVEYCLSERKPERCRLQFSMPFLVVVIVFNLVKVTCMVMTLWWQREATLVTVGGESFSSNFW